MPSRGERESGLFTRNKVMQGFLQKAFEYKQKHARKNLFETDQKQ